jgi:hypothetical protein
MGADERNPMAHSLSPSIHNIEPDDVSVQLIRDRQVSVGFRDDRGLDAGALFIAGDTDRQRLANLLAIAARIRQATLDLIAELQGDDVAEVHTALGRPLPLPEPLHGTQVARVATDEERAENARRHDEARRAQYPEPTAVTA